MRKGQAAMEFLMTYGWAILVVLISIGALAYFGVNKAEQFLPEKCLIATSSGIFCEEFSTSSSADTVTLRLRNILPDPVSVSSITLDDPSCAAAAGGVVGSDSEADFILECSAGLNPKQKIKGSLAVDYSVGSAGLAKSTTGQLITVVP
ncbi:MAG TPA: hypothetical protein VJB08_02485 [Candidatus Nanoarchaeia archaeon]|nr:hypothetical protein [Candidatus Nanoarchaeia archaeon]